MRRHRGRRDRPRRGPRARLRGPRGAGARGRRYHRQRDQLAQQRGHPRRHLLSAGEPQGPPLRRRQSAALPLLHRPRRGPRADRQADRGRPPKRARAAPRPRAHRCRERRRRSRDPGRRQRPRARARARLRGGAALALHRHHRFARPDAVVAGRSRIQRRGDRLPEPIARRPGRGPRLRARGRRRGRPHPTQIPCAGQRGGARRPGRGQRHSRPARGACPAPLPGQGELLQRLGPGPLQAPHLPGAGERQPRPPLQRRPRRAGQVRTRPGMGRGDRLPGRGGAGRALLRRDSALLPGLGRGRAAARLRRRAAQAAGPRRGARRLPDPGPGRARHPRARQPVRHRIAGPHRGAGDRR